MKNGWKKICRCRKGQMLKGIVLTLTLAFLTMGLCGCAEKHDAAEELEEFTLEGESDVEKNSSNSKTESEKGSQGGTDAEEGLPETLYVHVCGAVNAPGVYKLRTDARIYEALEAAGGMTEDAAADWINQAEALSDGERIYVPTQEEVNSQVLAVTQDGTEASSGNDTDNGTGQEASGEDTGTEQKIDLNTADVSQLTTLTGVGESKALAIIAYREENGPFTSAEDIMNVPGIKEGTYEKIKDKIAIK